VDTRWLEFGCFYGVLPIAFALAARRLNYRGAMAPLLWLLSLGVGIALYRDPHFEPGTLWKLPLDHPYVHTMLRRFVALAAGLIVLGRWLAPERFMWMPRQRPAFWLLFIVAYPTLSALPQGIIWRVFLAHRYATLFPGPFSLLIAGAAAFSLAHLAFWNRTALAVTAIGGAVFLSTYLQTGSMLLAALEHGAYGIVAFSAGFGAFLYRGAPSTTPRPSLPASDPTS
jgi:uncharacterized protein